MGIRDPHNKSKMGTQVPTIPGKWGPGVPVLGDPHFYLTPGLHGAGVDVLQCSGELGQKPRGCMHALRNFHAQIRLACRDKNQLCAYHAF